MNRRHFCRTALAASVAAAIPMLPGCERKAPVATEADTNLAAISLDGAEIELEIRPDGSVKFTVSGAPGEGCEALERLLLEALQGEVTDREHTPEYHQRRAQGLGGRLKAMLGRKK